MGRLPPAEKLSLALRKNVRDEWDSNKADLENQLSEILGQPWTIEVDPLAIYPYHNDGYAKDNLGGCIKSYIEGAIYQLKYLTGRHDDLVSEINTLASAHILTLDVEETDPPRWSYTGSEIDSEGKLRILFNDQNLGVNTGDSLQEKPLFAALNTAPTNPHTLSFLARHGIHVDYEPEVASTQGKIAELLGLSPEEVKLTPNFEDSFTKLKEYASQSGSSIRDDWQEVLGNFTLKYFEGIAWNLKNHKVQEDELVREGFLEAVSSNEFVFRIVDELKGTGSSYAEVEIVDGVIYLQTTGEQWGWNIDSVGEKLIDLL